MEKSRMAERFSDLDDTMRAGMLVDLVERNQTQINSTIRRGLANGKRGVKIALNQPSSVTVKKDGGFKNMPLIGGEVFVVERVYVGKLKKPIFCFRYDDSGEVCHLEMKGSDCLIKLDGFAAYLEDLFDKNSDIIRTSDNESLTEKLEKDSNAKVAAAVEASRKALLAEKRKKEKEEKYKAIGYGAW